MGLFGRLRRGPRRFNVQPVRAPAEVERRLLYLPTGGRFDVVGEASYQDVLAWIAGPKTELGHYDAVVAVLMPDDDNPYDTNAVEVIVRERTVAYVPRNRCMEFRGFIDRARAHGRFLAAHAVIVGGWDRGGDDVGHFGIYLDINLEPGFVTANRSSPVDQDVLEVAPPRHLSPVATGRLHEVAGEAQRAWELTQVLGRRDAPFVDERFVAAIIPNGDDLDVVALCRLDDYAAATRLWGSTVGRIPKRNSSAWAALVASKARTGQIPAVQAVANGYGIDDAGKRSPLRITLDAEIGTG